MNQFVWTVYGIIENVHTNIRDFEQNRILMYDQHGTLVDKSLDWSLYVLLSLTCLWMLFVGVAVVCTLLLLVFYLPYGVYQIVTAEKEKDE